MLDVMNSDSIEKIWAEICSYPTPKSCNFIHIIPKHDMAIISTTCSRICSVTKKQVHHEILTKINLKKRKAVRNNVGVVQAPSVEAWSHDRQMVARVFAFTHKNKQANYVEIWSNNSLLDQISLADQSLHERIYDEGIAKIDE
ncbi:hypothetical protein RF11_15740 [Thelohanellus kitauei]|uniref:Uncharacterized protein n=1 Tax=Thelohanellus kitauei TaxID=669202 RepID=A0A0C2IQP8_THEKT|nr:hypothetical protein RF11_15740 [Thelohanellus kitauei]